MLAEWLTYNNAAPRCVAYHLDYDFHDVLLPEWKRALELKALWKKLVCLYHPDRFVNQPEKLETSDHFHVNEALVETAELLQLPYLQAPMLFEAAFSHQGMRVRHCCAFLTSTEPSHFLRRSNGRFREVTSEIRE